MIEANTRRILTEAIERGIECGYMRAHKHTDTPTEAVIKAEMDRAIWNNIDEWFTFPMRNEE